jgi:hypothetical protein
VNARIAKFTRIALLVALAALPVGALHAQDDVVMRAMRDELARSMSKLTLENLEKPYYIAYRLIDSEHYSVAASFGALNHSSTDRARLLSIEVRVGDYQLDNSHFFSWNFDMGRSMQTGLFRAQLPLEDDYKEVRRQIWLATDNVYKKAVEDLAKKRAMLQNQKRADDTADFSKETPLTTRDERPAMKIDQAGLEAEARRLSALFRQMPAIATSDITFNGANTYTRYVNSEGTSYIRRLPSLTFNVDASTQAPDGASVDDFVWYYAHSAADLPSEEKLAGRIRKLGADLAALRDAPTLQSYNGPVLAEGDAAAQLIRLVFSPNLIGSRAVESDLTTMGNGARVVGMPGRATSENPFLDRVGSRVMPAFMSLTDNPLISEYQGYALAGASKVDEDGVLSQEVKLVENGYLRSLLTTRDPVRGFERSTGSRHAGGTTPSNLIVTTTSAVSSADLRAQFISLINQRHLPFGIVVRRLRNPNNAEFCYKLFPDGHEELVRDMQFVGLNASSFKDILAASKELNVLTVLYRPQQNNQFPTMTVAEENFRPVTVVAPSLLFEDLTMRKIHAVLPNPPVAPHPFFDK